MVYTCDPSTWQGGARGAGVQGRPWPHPRTSATQRVLEMLSPTKKQKQPTNESHSAAITEGGLKKQMRRRRGTPGYHRLSSEPRQKGTGSKGIQSGEAGEWKQPGGNRRKRSWDGSQASVPRIWKNQMYAGAEGAHMKPYISFILKPRFSYCLLNRL